MAVLQTIALASNIDYLGVMQEAVKDGRGGRYVADQLAPLFQRTIRCHHRRLQFVPPHDHLKKVFARPLGQRLDAHVVNYQQVALEVFVHNLVLPGEGFVTHKIANNIEDRPVLHRKPILDSLITDGLCDVTFTHTGRANQQNISALTNELAGSKVIHRLPRHRRIERKIKAVYRLEFPEHRLLETPLDHPFAANLNLVLQKKFQELRMVQLVAGGFLKSYVQRTCQAT